MNIKLPQIINPFLLIFLLTTSYTTHLNAQNADLFFDEADVFFKTNVKNGGVAYEAIKSDPSKLNSLLKIAKETVVNEKNNSEYKAFWINAYNLSVIKGIVEHYPTKSPLNINVFFEGITYQLAGKIVTLNEIENKLLRAKFNDARLHFVLVCGAISCPPIIDEAYKPNSIEEQLEKQTKLALNGTYFIKVDTKKKTVSGSEILKWYKEDFTQNGTSEIDFINKYREQKIPSNFKLKYYTYNWNINKQ
jgi:hypothetical protein